jgi:phosphoribosylaminoimidazole carboxylase
MSEMEQMMEPLIDAVNDQSGKPLGPKSTAGEHPQVAVVMGSDSDMPVLKACLEVLDKFRIPYQARITSAHRTPDWMREFAKDAKDNGFKVIIAAAGGAAHLPGMAASWTVLPVIGVPVKGQRARWRRQLVQHITDQGESWWLRLASTNRPTRRCWRQESSAFPMQG